MGRDAGSAAAPPRPLGRRATRFWIPVWLVPLLDPALAVRSLDQPWPAALGLAVLVGGFVTVLWRDFCWPREVPGSSRPQRPRPQQWSLLALVTVAGVALALGYADGSGTWLLPLLYVAVAGVATLPGSRAAFAWVAGVVAVLLVVWADGRASADGVASVALSIVLAGLIVHMFRRLALAVEELRATRTELAETAVHAERQRFSRDLHDLLGHTLSLIVVKAEVIRRSAERDPAAAVTQAGDIERTGRRALTEIREAVAGYQARPVSVEIEAARRALADAGIAADVDGGTPELTNAEADSVLGWVVREAVTNAVRHSGATRCTIRLTADGGRCIVEVRDDGTGSAGELANGHGLSGLDERVRAAGGTLEAGPAEAGGWRVRATVPAGEGSRP